MAIVHKSPLWASLLLHLLAATRCAALTQQYCSSENTAGSNDTLTFSIYNSNGLCHDHCASQYAFAVVQYQNCWCSNYVPADQLDVTSCNQNCPGYGSENCGNLSNGLFGYIALPNAPAGTAGGSSSPTSTTPSQKSTSSAPSSTSSPQPSPTPTTETSTTTQTPTTSSTTSKSTSTTPSPTLVTNTQVVTISGAVITQTVTSTPQPVPTSGSVTEKPQLSKSNTGAIVGGVVGGVAGLILILAILFFFLWRRRDRQRPADSRRLGRNASLLSKSGLLGGGRTRDPEKSTDDNFGAQRHSALYNENENSPVSAPGAVYERSESLGRRNSRPLVYDQRLNPAALMENWQLNGSRSSINTMQDQRDYSRPLGVTNPDPHD